MDLAINQAVDYRWISGGSNIKKDTTQVPQLDTIKDRQHGLTEENISTIEWVSESGWVQYVAPAEMDKLLQMKITTCSRCGSQIINICTIGRRGQTSIWQLI